MGPQSGSSQDLKKLTDRDLADRFLRGDDDAVEALIRRHWNAVFQFARSRVQKDVAEDVTTETFRRAVNSLRQWNGQASALSWLRTIARNASIDWGRRPEQRHELLVEAVPEDSAGAKEAGSSTRMDVEDALAQIPPEQATVLRLHYWAGLTTKEIAAELEDPEGTIKRRLQLGRKALVPLLAGYGERDGS